VFVVVTLLLLSLLVCYIVFVIDVWVVLFICVCVLLLCIIVVCVYCIVYVLWLDAVTTSLPRIDLLTARSTLCFRAIISSR